MCTGAAASRPVAPRARPCRPLPLACPPQEPAPSADRPVMRRAWILSTLRVRAYGGGILAAKPTIRVLRECLRREVQAWITDGNLRRRGDAREGGAVYARRDASAAHGAVHSRRGATCLQYTISTTTNSTRRLRAATLRLAPRAQRGLGRRGDERRRLRVDFFCKSTGNGHLLGASAGWPRGSRG